MHREGSLTTFTQSKESLPSEIGDFISRMLQGIWNWNVVEKYFPDSQTYFQKTNDPHLGVQTDRFTFSVAVMLLTVAPFSKFGRILAYVTLKYHTELPGCYTEPTHKSSLVWGITQARLLLHTKVGGIGWSVSGHPVLFNIHCKFMKILEGIR